MNYNEKTQNALNERKINYDMFRMKLCAIGYLLQKYQDPTETKAMILCDAESGEGGEGCGHGRGGRTERPGCRRRCPLPQ